MTTKFEYTPKTRAEDLVLVAEFPIERCLSQMSKASLAGDQKEFDFWQATRDEVIKLLQREWCELLVSEPAL